MAHEETHEDWIREWDAMLARLGISDDPAVKASRMNSIVAFTPLNMGRQQQSRSTNVTQHLEASNSNDKNPGKAGESS